MIYQFLKYGISGAIAFGILFGGNYLFTGVFNFDPRWSNLISVTLAYFFIYFSSSNFVFGKTMSLQNARHFIIYLIVFWALNNAFFSTVFSLTHWHYLIITLANIAIFFPIRFFSQKYFVFRA